MKKINHNNNKSKFDLFKKFIFGINVDNDTYFYICVNIIIYLLLKVITSEFRQTIELN